MHVQDKPDALPEDATSDATSGVPKGFSPDVNTVLLGDLEGSEEVISDEEVRAATEILGGGMPTNASEHGDIVPEYSNHDDDAGAGVDADYLPPSNKGSRSFAYCEQSPAAFASNQGAAAAAATLQSSTPPDVSDIVETGRERRHL
jgi:hypothetical protein